MTSMKQGKLNRTRFPIGLLPWALPAIIVICIVELQRHSTDVSGYLYATGSLVALVVWGGVLTERSWAHRALGLTLNLLAFGLLIGAITMSAEGNPTAGKNLASDLLFWSPAICAWWGAFYAERLSLSATLVVMFFAGLYVADASVPLHSFLDYLVLATLLISLVRAVAGFRSNSSASLGNQWQATSWSGPDPVTGTTNRNQFEAELSHLAAVSNRYRLPFSLLAIAIDRYESDIAPLDEAASDEILRSFAWKLAERLRTPDTICHWENGKFFVLLPNTIFSDATRVAESIQCAAQGIALTGGRKIDTRIGVCSHRFGEDPMSTLDSAERALTRAIKLQSDQPMADRNQAAAM